MKGFLLGLLVAGLVFAGYLTWDNRRADRGSGKIASTRPDGGTATKKRKRRARGAARLARVPAPAQGSYERSMPPEPEPEPEPVRLSAADLRTLSQGDDLGRPDVLRIDMAEGRETPELTQDDIDARFRAEEPSILDCIAQARPDPETYVPGRVTVKFRIQRTGAVRGVRVDAPAILHKGGILGCIKPVVGRLRFPASGGSQIVTYPFTLS